MPTSKQNSIRQILSTARKLAKMTGADLDWIQEPLKDGLDKMSREGNTAVGALLREVWLHLEKYTPDEIRPGHLVLWGHQEMVVVGVSEDARGKSIVTLKTPGGQEFVASEGQVMEARERLLQRVRGDL